MQLTATTITREDSYLKLDDIKVAAATREEEREEEDLMENVEIFGRRVGKSILKFDRMMN